MKLDRGESAKNHFYKFDTEQPTIIIVRGQLPYLWIGGENGPCFATLQGSKNLRSLAKQILKAIGDNK